MKKGWAGEEMEMSHRREQLRNTDHSGTSSSSQQQQYYGTVNLEQFQNKEVGHGYQARGVIRQRTGLSSANLKIVDMRKKNSQQEKEEDGGNSVTSASGSKEKRMSKRKRSDSEKKREEIPTDPTEQFLRCKALRDFRKELEKILSESKR